jgi:C1A family cysteine protease
MHKTGIRWVLSFFVLVPFLFFLSVLGSPVLATTPEIEGIREQIRNKGARWLSEETSITKLPAERRLKRLGLLNPVVPKGGRLVRSTQSEANDTEYLNYNEPPYEYVTPIKDQGDCGGCWAFSTTAALESQVLKATRAVPRSINLSEQIIISCSGTGNCESGGYIEPASNFIRSTGLPPENCFPYTATDNKCSNAACPFWQSDTDAITGWQYVMPTVAGLKNALLKYGPLVVTMNVYSDFYSYAGGVYSHVSGSFQGGHAVELIGYDNTNQCFIAKNSWGVDWGESEVGFIKTRGFFRIAYSEVSDGDVRFAYDAIAYDGYKAIQSFCSYSVSPTSITVSYVGGYAEASVATQPGCSRRAVSHVRWIKIVSGANGTGDGIVRYRVHHNKTDEDRTGALTIAGKTLIVKQQKRPLLFWRF